MKKYIVFYAPDLDKAKGRKLVANLDQNVLMPLKGHSYVFVWFNKRKKVIKWIEKHEDHLLEAYLFKALSE